MFRGTQFAGERERIANALHFGARVQPRSDMASSMRPLYSAALALRTGSAS